MVLTAHLEITQLKRLWWMCKKNAETLFLFLFSFLFCVLFLLCPHRISSCTFISCTSDGTISEAAPNSDTRKHQINLFSHWMIITLKMISTLNVISGLAFGCHDVLWQKAPQPHAVVQGLLCPTSSHPGSVCASVIHNPPCPGSCLCHHSIHPSLLSL